MGPTGSGAPSPQQTAAQGLGLPETLCPNNQCNGIQFLFSGNSLDISAVTNLARTCTASGGTVKNVCLDGNLGVHGLQHGGSCSDGTNKAVVCSPGRGSQSTGGTSNQPGTGSGAANQSSMEADGAFLNEQDGTRSILCFSGTRTSCPPTATYGRNSFTGGGAPLPADIMESSTLTCGSGHTYCAYDLVPLKWCFTPTGGSPNCTATTRAACEVLRGQAGVNNTSACTQ